MQVPSTGKNQLAAASQKQCAITAIDKVWIRLNQLLVQSFPPMFKAGRKPTDEQIAKTRMILAEAQNSLSLRVTPADIAKIYTLLSGGMAMTKDNEAEITSQAYIDALACRSSWALNEAYTRIIQGEAKPLSQKFMPQAPELSQFCKEIEYSKQSQIKLIAAILAAPEEKAPEPAISQTRFLELRKQLNQFAGDAA